MDRRAPVRWRGSRADGSGGDRRPGRRGVARPRRPAGPVRIVRSDATAQAGSTSRLVGDVSLGLYPAPQAMKNRMEVGARATVMRDFRVTTDGPDRRHTLVTEYLDYYFLRGTSPDRKAGIALAHTHGEDPVNGLESQAFWRVAFSFQVQ